MKQGADLRSILLAGLRVGERRLNVAGVSTVFLECGEGPTVVLLHGGIELGGAYWAPVIPSLAQRHRVVVPDVPGLGESDPVARLDRRTFSRWFAALLEHTCDEKPTLVAHSLFGTLAAAFASEHGNLLRSVALYGSLGIGPYRMPLGLMLTAILFSLRPSLSAQHRFLPWAFFDPAATRNRHPEWFDAFNAYSVARGRVPHVKRAMRQLVQLGTKQLAERELRSIEIPVALLWGRHDRMAPLRLAEAAAAQFGWALHVIENAGHLPHVEQPNAFVRALRATLPSEVSV